MVRPTTKRTVRPGEPPRDDNGNRTADGWEVAGVPTDRSWDGETVPGQDKAGDGLTLYNDYRGIVALDLNVRNW
jgi:hypothetical protein